MKPPISLTMDEPTFRRLYTHLFPGDHDEHGAVLSAGIVETDRGTRLLARDLFLARDRIDYVPSTRGYRALTADFVAEKSDYCSTEQLCYLAIHNHGGDDSVGFSDDDMASHERGYPALLDITHDGPVGALVFASNAVAGDIWTPSGRHSLDHLTIIGFQIRRLYPSPQARPPEGDFVYDRHARLFGDGGQAILSGLKVVIIGLGGGGSLLNEWLARLGVGHIVAIDPERVALTNLPRVVGATRRDALAFLAASRVPWLKKLAERYARHKVLIARRVAKQANPNIRYDAIVGTLLDEATARLVVDADFVLLATDNIQSRLVFNAIVHQYLIPGAQVGVKVTTDTGQATVNAITVLSRLVLPYAGGGCLSCNGLIPPGRLAEEALTERERRAQRYVDADDVAEPSVITLNAISAAQAANDLMMLFTGLYRDSAHMGYRLQLARSREIYEVATDSTPDEYCLACGSTSKSRRAKGDRVRLPCRMPTKINQS